MGQLHNDQLRDIALLMKLPSDHYVSTHHSNLPPKISVQQNTCLDATLEYIHRIKEECEIFLKYEAELRAVIKIQTFFRGVISKRRVKSWKKTYFNPQIVKRNKALSQLFKFELKALAQMHGLKEVTFYAKNSLPETF